MQLRAEQRRVVELLPALSGAGPPAPLQRAASHRAAVRRRRSLRLHDVYSDQPAGLGPRAGSSAPAHHSGDNTRALGPRAAGRLQQGSDGAHGQLMHLQPGRHLWLRDGEEDERVARVQAQCALVSTVGHGEPSVPW